MNLLQRLFPNQKIRKTRLIVIPREKAGSMLPHIQPHLADFDEPVTTSVRGPYLVEARDVPEDIMTLLTGMGASEAAGYAVPLGEWSHRLGRVEGEYCAVYQNEIVYTLDRSTARKIRRFLSANGSPGTDPVSEMGSRETRDGVNHPVGPWYQEKFNTELQILFPLAFMFLVLSIASLLLSIRVFIADSSQWDILLWSFAPLIFYTLIVHFCIFRTETISRIFVFETAHRISSTELRRSRYAQILLGIVFLLSSFGAFDSLSWWFLSNAWAQDGLRLAFAAGLALLSASVLLMVNKKRPTTAVRIVFVILLLLIFGFTDTIDQTIAGRSLLFQMIPIMVASFTIAPLMSFVFAVISVLMMTLRSVSAGIAINSTGYLGFLLIAFISWLVASGWEGAINESENLNITLEKRVAERTKQLAEANKFKSHFLAQISHELQSPIIAFSLFVKRNKPLFGRKEGAAMEDETLRVLEMAKSISTVSRIELDVLEDRVVRRPIDLTGLIDQQIEVLRIRAEEKGIHLEHLCGSGQAQIWGNRGYATRIIDNLLTNAIKYSNPGGQITIGTSVDGEFLQFRIDDHGIGIPPAELPRIFDRFSRASNVGTRPGTGLGLSMVRDMVEAMHGRITIDSTLGQGTTVTLRFPLLPEAVR